MSQEDDKEFILPIKYNDLSREIERRSRWSPDTSLNGLWDWKGHGGCKLVSSPLRPCQAHNLSRGDWRISQNPDKDIILLLKYNMLIIHYIQVDIEIFCNTMFQSNFFPAVVRLSNAISSFSLTCPPLLRGAFVCISSGTLS